MSNAETRPPKKTLNLETTAAETPPSERRMSPGAGRSVSQVPARSLSTQTPGAAMTPRGAAATAQPVVKPTYEPEPVVYAEPPIRPTAAPVATQPRVPTPVVSEIRPAAPVPITGEEPSLGDLPALEFEFESAEEEDPTAHLAPVTAAPTMGVELSRPLKDLVRRRDAQNFKDFFRDLIKHGVSDVHMTRSILDGTFTVEARVDGVMQEVHSYKGVEAQTIHTLIKTDSKMSSGVNLVPEDGNYELPINGYPYRARAAALPLFDGGERIVFRLPQIGELRSLEDLGFTDANLAATKSLLDRPGGMTLFAGPTGEGKSTTSLSSLKYLREQHGGVFITLEDPVERVIPGVAQIEVKEEIEGAGFGDMMKYLVRSDPNVLFIGEIRDSATATAAVEIAKSGIRVLGTIHATNNVSAFLRLMEMADATPLSVLESMNGVISQRLVRRLADGGTDRFVGRYPIHEVTQNSEVLTDALVRNHSRAEITEAAATTSTTFRQNVDELIYAGITTRDEARKVIPYV